MNADNDRDTNDDDADDDDDDAYGNDADDDVDEKCESGRIRRSRGRSRKEAGSGKDDKIAIYHVSGEGGEFSKEELAKVIAKFYEENF